jgi:hypothetical protein
MAPTTPATTLPTHTYSRTIGSTVSQGTSSMIGTSTAKQTPHPTLALLKNFDSRYSLKSSHFSFARCSSIRTFAFIRSSCAIQLAHKFRPLCNRTYSFAPQCAQCTNHHHLPLSSERFIACSLRMVHVEPSRHLSISTCISVSRFR